MFCSISQYFTGMKLKIILLQHVTILQRYQTKNASFAACHNISEVSTKNAFFVACHNTSLLSNKNASFTACHNTSQVSN